MRVHPIMLCSVIIMVTTACDGGDGESDGSTEDAPCLATTGGGECNALRQCGCGVDWCKWMLDTSTCTLYEGCTASVPGILEPGEVCDEAMIIPDPPWCRPGSICLRTPGEADGTCRKLCSSDSDCAETGQTCVTPEISFEPTDPHACLASDVEIPFGVCG